MILCEKPYPALVTCLTTAAFLLDQILHSLFKKAKGWIEFTKEVYTICPDVVDQDIDTIQALTDEMIKQNYYTYAER